MAQNTLEILIKANSKQATGEIKKLDSTLGKFGATSGKGIDVLKSKWTELDNKLSSPTGMKAVIGTAGAVAGALIAAGAAAKKLADDYMNYAFQVQDFARIIGETPEEASKLIQVADDVRLSVEQMTVAMKNAVAKGYTPNMQGLMKLADEYNAIQSPIERTRFAMEVFGQRAGPQMAKLLEKGSAAIQQMGDSIVGTGRYMTAEGVAKAEAYYAALDDLDDAIADVSLTLGGEFAPAIANVAKGLTGLVKDASPLVAMFGAMQAGMERGAVSGWDVVKMFGAYMSAAKTSTQITAELNSVTNKYDATAKKLAGGFGNLSDALNAVNQAEKDNVISKQQAEDMSNALYNSTMSLSTAQQILTGKYNDASEAQTTLTSRMAAGMGEVQRYGNAALVAAANTDGLGNSLSGVANEADNAGQSISDMVRKAGQAAKLESMKLDFQASLEFSMPDIAGQMKNVMDSIDWKAAGGQALQDFINGMGAQGAEINKQLAANIGAVDVALKVETGDLTQQEGINQIKELFSEIGGIDTTQAKSFIDSVGKMSPPDLTSFLTSLQALGGQTGADAAKSASDLATQIAAAGTNASTNAQVYTNWANTTKEIATNADNAQKMQEEFTQKIIGTTTAIGLGQGALSGWNTTTYNLIENAQGAAGQVGALNTQIKNLPSSKTINIYVVTHGSVPGSGTDSGTGDNPGPRPPGGRGQTGLNMIVPPGYLHDTFPIYASSGERVMIQTPSQQTSNSNVTNITNNYYVTAPPDINVRQLAREVTREQQRAGVT